MQEDAGGVDNRSEQASGPGASEGFGLIDLTFGNGLASHFDEEWVR